MIPPLLVLEGPDCSGKTTLAKAIAHYFGGVYFHCNYTESLGHAMGDYQENVLDNAVYAINRGQIWAIDRHWPSEVVYSSVFRPNMYETAVQNGSDFDQIIKQVGGLYIFCDDSDVEERHAKQQDPAHPYDAQSFHRVCEGYRELFDRMHEDWVVRYNMQVHGYDLPKYIRTLETLR